MKACLPPNEPRRTNIGAAPSPLHLALSLLKGENDGIRSVRRHPSDPYRHCQGVLRGLVPYVPFVSLRQGKEPGQRRLAFACSVREPTSLGRDEAWACLPLAKAARMGEVLPAKGSWVEGGVLTGRAALACY